MLLGSVAVAFVVGANIAWLNPAPDAAAYRPSAIPILWQYDADAGVEILSAAYFPDAFLQYPERISRPGYPAVVHAFGSVIAFVAEPIRPLSALEAAGAGYLLLKIVVLTSAALAAHGVLRRYVDPRAALLGSLLLLLHPLILEFSTTFHTTELQLVGSVLVLRMALWGVERHDRRAIAGGSRWAGIIDAATIGAAGGLLMLAKPVLVAPLAVLVALLLHRRFLEAVVGAGAFAVPQLLWPVLLESSGIPYRSWEVEEYGQGVWLLDAAGRGPSALFGAVLELVPELVVAAAEFHGILVPLAVLGLWSGWVRLDRRSSTVAVLMVLAAVAQFIAVRRTVAYMTADVAILVFGAAAATIVRGLDAVAARVTRAGAGAGSSGVAPPTLLPRGAGAVLGLWLALGLAAIGNLPWVAPWDQEGRDPEVLQNRLDILEEPERFTPEDRARARGGVIVEPIG